MKPNKIYRTAGLMGGIALAAICASQASAQDNPSAVGEIIVTGSRLPTPNQESVSPITSVGSQEISLQGRTNMGDLINSLPQNTINSTTDLGSASNPLFGPGGIANADLRGLGPQRTLVLVDGRRLGIGDANTQNNNSAPDLNQIPSILVDRVEVVTGGASATYGSDAIAGVVNFIMKKDFEGVQMDVKGDMYQHSQHNDVVQRLLTAAGPGFNIPKDTRDGYGGDLSVIFGANAPDGKGNLTGYLVYHHQNPVLQGSRDFSSCQLKVAASVPSCTGSPNSNQFILNTGTGTGFTGSTGYTVIGNTFVPYAGAPNTGSPGLLYNSNPIESLLQQDTRYLGGFMGHYDYSSHVNLYADFSMMNDKTNTVVAPSGFFEGSGVTANSGFLVNCGNPLLSAQQKSLLCSAADIAANNKVDLLIGRRNIEGGGRSSEYDHVNYRAVLGAKGDIAGPWKYDTYGSYYWTSLYQDNFNYLSQARMQRALLVGTDPTTGRPACQSFIDKSDTSCVPYNIFSQGGVTPAQVAYVNSYGTSYGTIQEIIGEADITGDLTGYGVKSPWASKGVSVAFGITNRRQKYNYAPDQAELANDLSGFGGAGTTINKTLGVTEYYTEFRAPLIQDKPFVQDLTFDGGYRYSSYTTGVKPSTYKAGLEWAVNDQIRFRTSFQRAIRAPNIVELYNPLSVTNTSDVSVDPCAPTVDAHGNSVAATATLAQCMRTGVTAAQYGNGNSSDTITQCPADQCAVLNGGNIALKPETADTFSIGFTTKPSFLKGFTGSIDYYHIKSKDLIGSIPLETTLDNCLATGDPLFCNGVVRAPSGILFGTTVGAGGYINGQGENLASDTNDGIDLQLAYDVDLNDWHLGDHGRLLFTLNGTENLKATTQPTAGAHTYDCSGLFGNKCQTVDPKWTHAFRISWQTPWDVLASVNWRYMSKVTYEGNTNDVTLGKTAKDTFDHIPSYSYVDLSAQWNVRKGVVVTAGVNNVFDKDPPFLNNSITGTGSPNTYPSYDLLGRAAFVALSAKF
jgi:iron complex outermembrane receptor protein